MRLSICLPLLLVLLLLFVRGRPEASRQQSPRRTSLFSHASQPLREEFDAHEAQFESESPTVASVAQQLEWAEDDYGAWMARPKRTALQRTDHSASPFVVAMTEINEARLERLGKPGEHIGSTALASLKRVVDSEPENHLAKSYYGQALLDEALLTSELQKRTSKKSFKRILERSLTHLDDARDLQEKCNLPFLPKTPAQGRFFIDNLCATFLLDTQVRSTLSGG